MRVKFTHDIYNAGTLIYERGEIRIGELERYVRRGQAIEVKEDAAPAPAAPVAGTRKGGKKA